MALRARMRSFAQGGLDRVAVGLARAAPHGAPLGKGFALAREDAVTARAWLTSHRAVRAALGDPVAEAWGDLLHAAVRVDVGAGRALALELPDLLAALAAPQRMRALRVLAGVVRAQPAASPLVARGIRDLLTTFGDDALHPFLARALALYTESPGAARAFLARETREGQSAAEQLVPGLPFAAVARALTLYARAHVGVEVEVRPADGPHTREAFTDGHHVYVPERVDTGRSEDDFRLYRVQTALAVGYLEHGTFALRLDGLASPSPDGWPTPRGDESSLLLFFRAFPNASLARDLFQLHEDARVLAAIRAHYPGVARDIDTLGPRLLRGDASPAAQARAPADATAERGPLSPVLGILAALRDVVWGISDAPGIPAEDAAVVALLADGLAAVRMGSVQDSALAVLKGYAMVADRMRRAEDGPRRTPEAARRAAQSPGGVPRNDGEGQERGEQDGRGRLRPERASAEDARVDARAQRYLRELQSGGPSGSALREARERAREELLRGDPEADYTTMERALERLQARGMRGATVDAAPDTERAATPVDGLPLDPDLEPGAVVALYPEWDSHLGDVRPAWTCVREQRVREGDRAWVDEVRAAERPRILELRRRFQAMRPEGMGRLRGEPDGEDIDVDRALAEAVAARAGHVREGRVHVRAVRSRRDVAVAFLVDLSSSTNESADGTGRRILDVQKAAIVVAAEAMAALGDPFAIWGFSGYGRAHVAFYEAKGFAEPWDDRAARRVGRLNFKMENRDGAAIRHATAKLLRQPAHARLLVLLSDGKPLDCGCDHYHDRYAQDDTRAALREARRHGVRVYCVTVDPTGPRYLPRMYGDVAWTVIDRVEQLPERLARALQGLLR